MMTAWLDDEGVVALPSGALVRGRSLGRPASAADLTLVLGRGPVPTWSCRHIAWPDFWIPVHHDEAVAELRAALHQVHDGLRVEVACRGGIGRTGTALAALAVLDGLPPRESYEWVRRSYHPRAIETPWQRRWLNRVA